MNKWLIGLIILVLIAPVIGQAQVRENLDLSNVGAAVDQNCDLANGPLVGEAWNKCQQYIYQVTDLATAATSSTQNLTPIREQIIDLMEQIASLNASLNTLTNQGR